MNVFQTQLCPVFREYKSKQQESTKIFFLFGSSWVASKCKINEYVDFKLMFLAKLSRINWGKYGIKWSRLSALRPMLCRPRQAPGLRE